MIPKTTSVSEQQVNDQQSTPPITTSAPIVAGQLHSTIQATASNIQYPQQQAQQLAQINEQKTKPTYPMILYDGPAVIKKQTKAQEKQALKDFYNDVNQLYALGQRVQEEETNEAKLMAERLEKRTGVKVLAAILRTFETYFDPASPPQRKKYKEHLIRQGKHKGYKKVDHRTTEFHLLSRMVRDSATKQASADAIILQKARKAGQTSYTFIDWVKRQGGLEKVRTSKEWEIDELVGEGKKPLRTKPKKQAVPLKRWRRLACLEEASAPDALKALPHGVQQQVTIVRYADRIDIWYTKK
jgi:hypothetical protein